MNAPTPPTRRPAPARGTGWQAVRDAVLARIRARDWPPGAAIPNEADLAQEFGCARATVNRALRDLAEAGLLERRRKAGTRVRALPVRMATLEIPVIRTDIEGRGAVAGYRLVRRALEPAPAAVAARLGLAAGAALDHLLAVHSADGAPFVVEERWTNSDAVPGYAGADLSAISANEWLVRNAPFSHGEIALSAVPAAGEVAALLGAAPGAALFRIARATWAGAVPVTAAELTYAEGHSIRMGL